MCVSALFAPAIQYRLVGHEFMVGDDGAGGEAHGTREGRPGALVDWRHRACSGEAEDQLRPGLEVVLQVDSGPARGSPRTRAADRACPSARRSSSVLMSFCAGTLRKPADFLDGVLIRGGHFLDGGAGFLRGLGGREDGGALECWRTSRIRCSRR